MRCKYCFHEKYGYSNDLLDIDKLKKYIALLCSEYDFINIIWHGGEPLLVPLSFYEEIYDFCDYYDKEFSFTIQTNGTLIDQEIVDFFKRRSTNFGLSFDGLNNEYTRGNTSKILDSIGLLQENGFRPGAVLVVNKTNVSNLIDEYNFFNSMGVGLKLNPMFIDGEAKMHEGDLGLNPDEYIENFVDFFKYWTLDNNGKINVATCNELVNLILNEHSGVCTFNSCLGKWLCFDSDSNIYPCDRLCTSEYSLGNIDTLSNINQIFESDVFYNLLKESVEKRAKCIDTCEYYKNCYAGCNANTILNKDDGYANGISCYIHKGILERIKSYVLKCIENPQGLNPQYVKILERAQYRRR